MEVANDKCTRISCEDLDDQKFNAPHHFTISNYETGDLLCKVDFQEGPIKEVGINGVSNEDLIIMVIARLEAFQKSDYFCYENEMALSYLNSALTALTLRTKRRTETDIEGTNNKDIY